MPVLMMGGAGTAGSDECTASRAKVLEGFTAITSDSDDELATGTLAFNGTALAADVFPNKTFYNTNPLTRLVGALAPNAISGLTATNYATGTCVLSWTKPKSKWSGIRVGYKRDSYPTSVNDSTATWFETSDANRTISVSAGYTYKFRAWNYLETSAGRIYGGYADVSFYAPNNAGSTTIKGSGTWTVPAGVRKIDIFGVGGGGGGQGGGSSYGRGGGGGGYTKTVTGISVTPYQVLTITIGKGGTGATSSAAATNGGDTIVKNASGTTLFSVGGGKAGSGNNGGAGGSGGGAAGIYRGDQYDTAGTAGASNGGTAKNNVWYTGAAQAHYYYGGAGQGTTTGEWGNTNNTKYGGGGGGGGRAGGSNPSDTSRYGGGAGGEGGGGKGASKSAESGGNGGANTGGGGGGGFRSDGSESTSNGGNGGTGILKIRWS